MHLVIVDDQHRTRQSLSVLLKTLPLITEVWEASDGQEALQVIEDVHPQVVIMDVVMPALGGLEATQIIKSRWPEIKVIVLSMYLEYQEGARQAGADAFISKGDSPDKLLEAICALIDAGHDC